MLLLSLVLCCNRFVGLDCVIAACSFVLLLAVQIRHAEQRGEGVEEWILTVMMFMAQLKQSE